MIRRQFVFSGQQHTVIIAVAPIPSSHFPPSTTVEGITRFFSADRPNAYLCPQTYSVYFRTYLFLAPSTSKVTYFHPIIIIAIILSLKTSIPSLYSFLYRFWCVFFLPAALILRKIVLSITELIIIIIIIIIRGRYL